jgi:uncharacterized protein (TIGR02466 family)
MATRALFPTLIYQATVPAAQRRELNARLLHEATQLRRDDTAGRRWSRSNYPGGYTSYGSLCRLQSISPTFARLEKLLDKHVARFARQLRFDLRGRPLAMTDCWVNLMPRGVAHTLHLHPHATLSGTYYVSVPPDSAALKLEDPRLDRYMAAPPRRSSGGGGNSSGQQTWVSMAAHNGGLLLFESWLRHEVPRQTTAGLRVSVSFNYSWF